MYTVPQPGPGGLPLALRLSEGLGLAAAAMDILLADVQPLG